MCVSVPPQHGKSSLISRYFPTWWLGRRHADQVLQCSYGHDLTVDWTTAGRDILRDHGGPVFGVTTLARAKRSAWDLYDVRTRRKTGGGLRGVGKGGGVTGRPVSLGLCDDLVKDRAEVANANLRQQAWDWFESAVLPRARRLIVIATRWHHDDIIGRLERRQAAGEVGEPWTFVNLPAVAEDDDPLGRAPGEVLWPRNPLISPGMDPVEWYDAKRREVGSYVWSALYQGRPTPTEGGMFRRDWLRYYDLRGHVAHVSGRGEVHLDTAIRFGTCDLATSRKTSGDYTALDAWAYVPSWGVLLHLDHVRDRIDAPRLVPEFRRLVERWKLGALFVERAGYQLAALQAIQEALQVGLPVREVAPRGDKVSRALPATAAMEGGRLLFRRDAPWQGELEDEVLSFPQGAHDDQVDSLSYAVLVSNDIAADAAAEAARAARREASERALQLDDGGWWSGAARGSW